MITIQEAVEWLRLLLLIIPTSRLRPIDKTVSGDSKKKRKVSRTRPAMEEIEAAKSGHGTQVSSAPCNFINIPFYFLFPIPNRGPKMRFASTSSRDDSKLLLAIILR
jgi:hypothetical protein